MTPGQNRSPLPSDYEDRISELEQTIAELEERLVRSRRQLEWWQQGRELFADSEAGATPEADTEPSDETASPINRADFVPTVDEIRATGAKPKLRHAVLRVFLDFPTRNGHEPSVAAGIIIDELTRHGWMPGGKNADNIVRHMLRELAKKGQLRRPSYGRYALAPSVRGSLTNGDST